VLGTSQILIVAKFLVEMNESLTAIKPLAKF
jgi:hypothetical protein